MKDPKNQKTKRAHSRLEKTIMFEKTNRVCLVIVPNCFNIMETFLASKLR